MRGGAYGNVDGTWGKQGTAGFEQRMGDVMQMWSWALGGVDVVGID